LSVGHMCQNIIQGNTQTLLIERCWRTLIHTACNSMLVIKAANDQGVCTFAV